MNQKYRVDSFFPSEPKNVTDILILKMQQVILWHNSCLGQIHKNTAITSIFFAFIYNFPIFVSRIRNNSKTGKYN